MATVYNRIQNFHSTGWFRFPQKHVMIIGSLVAKHYRDAGHLTEHLPLVDSIEDNHIYLVFFYPEEFTPQIDRMILKYFYRLRAPKLRWC